jgi:DNA repair exonuclease SbcCD ATPase subunit
MDKYTEEYNLLSELISQYKCQKCKKYNKKFKFYLLTNCDHIICHKCFKEKAKEKKKCPVCSQKFDPKSEEEEKEFIEMDFKQSAQDIDNLIKKNYEEKKEKEKKEKDEEKEKDRKKEKNNEEDKEKKDENKKDEKVDKDKNNEKNSEKSDSDDGKDNNNSMG